MTIQSAQDLVDQWISTVGIRYFNELTNTTILMEEVGELSRIMARRFGEQSYKIPVSKEEEFSNLEEEMADVLFVLICLANQTGVNLEKALVEKMQIKTNRDELRHKNNPKLND